MTVENSGGAAANQVVLGFSSDESTVVVRAVVIDGQRQQVGPQPLSVSVGQLEPTVSRVVEFELEVQSPWSPTDSLHV